MLGRRDSVVKAIIDTSRARRSPTRISTRCDAVASGSSNATQLSGPCRLSSAYGRPLMSPSDQARFKANIAPYLPRSPAFAVAGIPAPLTRLSPSSPSVTLQRQLSHVRSHQVDPRRGNQAARIGSSVADIRNPRYGRPDRDDRATNNNPRTDPGPILLI